MSIKKLLAVCIALLTTIQVAAQTEPEITLALLANDKIADVNIDEEKYIKATKGVLDFMKKEFSGITTDQKIAVLLITHKTGKPTIELYAQPKLTSEKEQHFLEGMKALHFENTKLVDFPVLFNINVKDATWGTHFKEFISPTDRIKTAYENADLQTKYALNKTWAIEEVLPILSAYQKIVDAKFAGVKNFGTLIAKTNFAEDQNLANITSRNPDYWRAILEMNIGNQLVPATKIFTHIARGEFDHAQMYLDIIDMFSDPKSTADAYLSELSWRLKLFTKQLNAGIGKGIAAHDKGKYEDAIGMYNGILKTYPNSAWALYELYYSENALDIKNEKIKLEDRSNWDKAKIKIYASNPLYGMDVRASNAKEGYLLFRRQEISTLFKSKDERINDVYKYADIAMDLEVYDFAAQLFWYAFTFGKNNTQALNRFLYCLEKLGVTNLKTNFKGDFAAEFLKIKTEKEAEMKDSPMYKAFKN